MNKWSNYGKWRHPEKRKQLMKDREEKITADTRLNRLKDDIQSEFDKIKWMIDEYTITKEKTMTEESKQKISKALKGKRDHFFSNPEEQKKHSELMRTNNPMLGRKHSEETILKMRETKKRRDLKRAESR